MIFLCEGREGNKQKKTYQKNHHKKKRKKTKQDLGTECSEHVLEYIYLVFTQFPYQQEKTATSITKCRL